jgi:hypothetical protein
MTMNTRGLSRQRLSILFTACAAFALLLSACQPAAVPTSLPTAPAKATMPPAADTDTPPAVQPTQPAAGAVGELSLDLSGIAQDQLVETVAAVPASTDSPYWEILPEYHRVTLLGYPLTSHLHKPQIFVYPAADLAKANEGAGRIAADLQALLQARQAQERMPFLPLFNAQQVFHAQVQFLDFKNGSGVRFLTQFDQAPLPVNSYELFYTYQGLTKDGKYYIAAVLPLSHPDLPATDKVSEEQAADLNEFPAYLTKTVAWLEQQPGASFTPDLARLDALIQSIEVK